VFLVALLQVARSLHLQDAVILSLLVVMVCVPQLFGLSAHVMRQFMAAALTMAYLASASRRSAGALTLGILGAMMHFSALLLLLLGQLIRHRRFTGAINVMAIVGLLVAAYASVRVVAAYLVDLPIVGAIFWRLSNNEGYALDPISTQALVAAVVLGLVSLWILVTVKGSQLKDSEWQVAATTALVSLMVLASSLVPTLTELSTRYFYFLYFLGGMLLPYVLARLRPWPGWIHCAAVASPPLFLAGVANSIWHYAPVSSVATWPAWQFWTYHS
jgi:hypothetical protein